jgi:hypothetical protein
MVSFKRDFGRYSWTAVVAFTVLVALAQTCVAGGHGCDGCGSKHHFDGSTICRWKHTWHGPNANWTPLTPYYIPRPQDPCLYGGHAGWGRQSCGPEADYGAVEEVGFDADYAIAEPGYAVSPSLQPGMERLGQIPNDVGIAVGGPMTPAPPPATR